MPTNEQSDVGLAPGPRDVSRSSGRNVIAAIGIDQHSHWPQLTNAVRDAKGVLSQFQELGFEQLTGPLFDEQATGAAIRELVTDDLATLGPNDNLVLFFAGHGGVRKQQFDGSEKSMGYLIPFDASNKVATWIDLTGWLKEVSFLRAKHKTPSTEIT